MKNDKKPSRVPKESGRSGPKSAMDKKNKGKPTRPSTPGKYDDKKPSRDASARPSGRKTYAEKFPSRDQDSKTYDGKRPSRESESFKPSDKKRFEDKRSSRDSDSRSYGKDKYDNRKPSRDGGSRPYERKKRDDKRSVRDNDSQSFGKEKNDSRRPSRATDARPERKGRDDSRASRDSDSRPTERKRYEDKKPYQGKRDEDGRPGKYSESFRPSERKRYADKKPLKTEDSVDRKNKGYSNKKVLAHKKKQEGEGLIRLNKFIANSGICSRREADVMIETGVVTVNGKIVTELGYKVAPEDQVKYGGQSLRREKPVYVLLNKPKDFITTLDDPQGRKTVMSLVANAGKERIFPVGRLDRNTTGLLLFTNDGELAKKLTHPKHGIKKIYHVQTDETVKKSDLEKIKAGIELEDGYVKADEVSYVGEAGNKKEVGIELHQGKNRIVRRIFEHLGYKVLKLDRVYLAGLTKKALPRGHWRFLNEKEIAMLKMIS